LQKKRRDIKAVIFDFGGVLMRTNDPEPRRQLAEQLGVSLEELEDIVFSGEEGRLAEVGGISSHERWRRVTARLGLQGPEAWETFPRQFFAGEVLDLELVDYVRRLRKSHKTALLSNASDSLDEYVREELGLGDAFDLIIISALVGLRKPDPDIYTLTLNRLELAPHEAVFVDDMQANVECAASIGVHAIRFATREELIAQLDALLDTAGQA
jgi:HAD superfamily hydrolase (TIGR01509 family)